MGDRNINVRSITGLNPVQDIMCDRLDIVRKITIDGSEPVTIQFLGYDPATQTTKYMTTTDTQYTAGVGLTLVDNGFAFSGRPYLRPYQCLGQYFRPEVPLLLGFYHLYLDQRLLQHLQHFERL